MANEEQLAILKQGVDVWNQWRKENPDVEIDLGYANLGSSKFLQEALSTGKHFSLADVAVDLSGINLSQANLNFVDLYAVNLSSANLHNANLTGAQLTGSNLCQADFSAANLLQVDFSWAKLIETDFFTASMGTTFFSNNDLSKAISLDAVMHVTRSTIGTDTLQKSEGKIPVEFLRGCGLSDLDIEYAKLADPDMSNEEISEITQNIFDLKATRPIQISPLFISYSHANSAFVDKLETKLNENGIRFWRDIHDAKAGRLETQIDRAIRHNPTVLLILSEHSTSSDWVEHEARLARKLEKELDRDVLCPIALDDSWETCNWPERIKEQIMEYNILDFSNWEDDAELDKMFKKLIDGLDVFYKK